MRRISIAVSVVCVALAVTSRAPAGQSSNQRQVSTLQTINAATASPDLLTWDRFVTDEVRVGSLRLRSQTTDPALPQRTVERFEQRHEGVRVWGAEVVRDSERGLPISIFGLVVPELSLSVQPSLSPEAARQMLKSRDGDEAVLLSSPELVIVGLDGGVYQLAYSAAVAGNGSVSRIFIDAYTGAELIRYSEVQTEGAIGTGTGVLGDRKKLSVDLNGGVYVAFDRLRPPIIETFDMRGNLARTKLLERGQAPYTVADLAADADNIWTDPAVVDAHVHVSWTYDFYFKRFGRSGLDGRNGPIDIVVNGVTQQGALALTGADFNYAVNANWCDVCGPGGRGRMFFGNGIPPGYFMTDSGRNYTYFAGALDIAAHELTHAVTSATSHLIYSRESGALNEAFSDMMGKSVEFFYHPAGGGVGQADYVIGKDISRSVRPGALNGDRSLANPALYGDPDHYTRYKNWPTTPGGDSGGVHTNSGIPNHVFYLAIEGGTNRTSGLSVQGVGAANREQIEKVFYRAFTLLLPATSTFVTARSATIQAARDLYGAGGSAERAVTQAWNAVGVPDPTSVANFTDTVAPRQSRTYVITMNGAGRYQSLLTWNSIVQNDLDLYLTPVNCSFTRPACILDQSDSSDAFESISWPVRNGERYWLTINNFSGPAATFLIQHFVSVSTASTAAVVPKVGAESTSGESTAANMSKSR